VNRVRCELKCDRMERTGARRVAPEDVKREGVDGLEVGQPVAQPQLTPHVNLESLRLGTGHASVTMGLGLSDSCVLACRSPMLAPGTRRYYQQARRSGMSCRKKDNLMVKWLYRLVVIIMLYHAGPRCSPERYLEVYIQHSHTPIIHPSPNAGVQSHEIAVIGFLVLLRTMYPSGACTMFGTHVPPCGGYRLR
jgi:hypothetical protein